MEKFAILVNTCDKYNHLWDNFITLFNRYWDHTIECEKYFLTETIAPEYPGFKVFLAGKVPYSECIKFALDRIDTPYVLWLQDDYFLRKKINKEKFNEYFKFISDYNVDQLGIKLDANTYTKKMVFNDYYKLDQNSHYSISMQASIWNTDFFKYCLIKDGVENPWEFEFNGTNRINKGKLHNIYMEVQHQPWYLEAMNKGKYTNDYFKIIQSEHLNHEGNSVNI